VEPAPIAVLSRILAQLQRGEIQIPAVPSVVVEVRDLVGRGAGKLDTVVGLIERDPALVARVLQLGRSVAVSGSNKRLDLTGIINRVGYRQLHNVVETVWSNGCFQIPDPRYEPYASRLTRQSVARAVAMRALAEAQGVDGFSAFLMGLFSDVGAAFLLWAIVDKARGPAPPPEAALEFIREHHEVIGSAVLKRWGHPESITNLTKRHHSLTLPNPPSLHANLLVVASQIAYELTLEEDLTAPAPWPPPELLERCLSLVGVELSSNVAARLRDQYAEEVAALSLVGV
jgi:HD-like signal output (HDOD) protein